MAQFIDWRLLLEEFDAAPESEKERIRRMFKEMPKRTLEKLFEKETFALLLYEKAVGPWKPPVKWSKELEQKLKDVFEATLRRSRLSPRRFWAEFRLELENVKELETEDEMIKAITSLAEEIARREIKPPRVKYPVEVPPHVRVLPPVPETCPIDGTRLEQIERAPLFITDPLRLTAEEAYYRSALGLPLPTEHLEWIPIPPTMKVWMCKAPEPHYFERLADGRLVQRTPEFLYRKILRETAKLRRITAPPAITPPLVPYRPTLLTFQRWIVQIKGMTFTEYAKKSEEERKKILEEYKEWYRRQIGKSK